MPKSRTGKHYLVIPQPDKGWLAEQPPPEETEDGDRENGQERKYEQPNEAGQQERIRLEGKLRTRPRLTEPLHCTWLSDGHSTRGAPANLSYIPSEFLHMPELLNSNGHVLREIATMMPS